MGADAITHDLSHALRTSLIEAQKIKERDGAASRSLADGNLEETLEYLSVDGRTTKRIKRQGLVDFISPRIEELFTVVQEELRNSGFGDRVAGGGVILTGGGSLLKGMAGAAEQILELPVRHGLPQGLAGRADILGHPSYATALGLLHYRHLGEWARSRRAKPQGGRLVSRIKSLIEEFF